MIIVQNSDQWSDSEKVLNLGKAKVCLCLQAVVQKRKNQRQNADYNKARLQVSLQFVKFILFLIQSIICINCLVN